MSNIDTLIRSNRKTLAIILEPDGKLTVRAPLRLSRRRIEQLVAEKADWIEKRRAQLRQAAPAHTPRRYLPGETFHFLGKAYPLEVVEQTAQLLELKDGHFRLAKTAQPQAAEVFEAWFRREARSYIAARIEMLAGRHGFAVKGLHITGAQTRWGSCSSRGSLNFTWRLIQAPPEAVEYVILHELAHLEHPNHSRQFWARVAALDPDYALQRRWLKENAWLLK